MLFITVNRLLYRGTHVPSSLQYPMLAATLKEWSKLILAPVSMELMCVRYTFSSFRNCIRKAVEITSLMGDFDSSDDDNIGIHASLPIISMCSFTFVFALRQVSIRLSRRKVSMVRKFISRAQRLVCILARLVVSPVHESKSKDTMRYEGNFIKMLLSCANSLCEASHL